MLYFIAGHSKSQIINSSGHPFGGSVIATAKKLEIFDLFGDITTVDRLSVAEITTAGPGGMPGVMLSVGADDMQPTTARYHPERQEWMQVSAAVWIGTEPDPDSGDHQSPIPEALERGGCVVNSFENVILADGNIWEIPVLREPLSDGDLLPMEMQRSTLPSVFYRNVSGQWVMDVVPKYRDLWQQSRVLLQQLMDGEPILYRDMMEFSAAVIGLRYRFNLLVHSRWPDRFLTTENATKVIRAAIGWNIIERHFDAQKKRQAISL